jgi:hypothetical protein
MLFHLFNLEQLLPNRQQITQIIDVAGIRPHSLTYHFLRALHKRVYPFKSVHMHSNRSPKWYDFFLSSIFFKVLMQHLLILDLNTLFLFFLPSSFLLRLLLQFIVEGGISKAVLLLHLD